MATASSILLILLILLSYSSKPSLSFLFQISNFFQNSNKANILSNTFKSFRNGFGILSPTEASPLDVSTSESEEDNQQSEPNSKSFLFSTFNGPPPSPPLPTTKHQLTMVPLAFSATKKKDSPSRFTSLTGQIANLLSSVNLLKVREEIRDGISSSASCMACHTLAELYKSPIYTRNGMSSALKTVCGSFRFQKPRVCNGIVDAYQDDLDFIFRNSKLDTDEMCAVLVGLDCGLGLTENLNWTTRLSPRAVDINYYPSSKITYEYASIVHVTDIHLDLNYVAGSVANCGEPLCCRMDSLPASSTEPIRRAQIWGDYGRCDTPLTTVVEALKRIKEEHPFADYWFWTGDIGPHDIWNSSKAEIIRHIQVLTYLLKQYGSPQILPVIGNHEGFPSNNFAPPEISGKLSVNWLYEVLAQEWSSWLPDSSLATLRYGGYYSLLLRPGLRVLALNTNYCARLNFWSLYENQDPGSQLQWLVDELSQAELAGEVIHLVGHIAPDNRECTQGWTNNFLRILDRYKSIIRGQFYGHTHKDEFRVYYSPQTSQPIGVAYLGPSLTSYKGNNPGYRVYAMDGQGWIRNHETYWFNLTEANRRSKSRRTTEDSRFPPDWKLAYGVLQDLNMRGLTPLDWHNLIARLHEDEDLFKYFHRLYSRFSDSKNAQSCNELCKSELLDELRVFDSLRQKSKLFQKKYN